MTASPDAAPDPAAFADALAKVQPLIDADPPIDPTALAEALQIAAVASLGLGRADDAEAYWRRSIAANPAFVDAYMNLGTLLAGLNRRHDLAALFTQLCAARPDLADAHNELGSALQNLGRFDEAAAAYRAAAQLAPNRFEFHHNLGTVLRPLDRWDEAAAAYRQALALRPGAFMTLNNLGNVLRTLGHRPEAEAAFRDALAHRSDFHMAKLGLATLLLDMGRYDEGWPLYENRYADPSSVQYKTAASIGCARWQGEPLAGKALLVWQEGGLGDVIQFSRYFSRLKAQGAARIVCVCAPALHRLLATVEGIEAVLDFDAGWACAAQFDCWTSLMSAPLYLHTTVDTIPAPVNLRPAESLIDTWRPRLAALPAGRKIGLVWKGNPLHGNDAHRSLPSLATLAPLWRLPNVSFVSLQKGPGESEALSPPAQQPLLHLGSDVADMADTAAIVAQLDLVICVDTSVAHLAASVGTPCWVMLPARDTDWRWMNHGDESPWYPHTMRLFRQTLNGTWADLVEQVRHACVACVASD